MKDFAKKNALLAALALILMLSMDSAWSEDYQYQYFKEEKDRYVPFSDYIPKSRLHFKTVPHYLEDFYLLYGMKQYYNENSLRKNIERMKIALECKFRHPSEALIKIESEEEYSKYRNLMFMHINILIMRDHMKIAARYDKRKIYFYNLDFAKEIGESLGVAEDMYGKALPYWEEARRYAERAGDYRLTTDMGHIESERYAIVRGELDYGRIINGHLARVRERKKELEQAAATNR